jgi:hypothetical protein
MSETERTDQLLWLEGREHIVAARKWRHGEYVGLTAARIYARIDTHPDASGTMSHADQIDPTSEELAEWLADGSLRALDISSASCDV